MNLANQTWRVLLVDDHPLIRDGLRAVVRHLLPLASIEATGSGSEAVKKAASFQPHLLLLDVNLPDLNGLEVARRIRATDPQIKILMVAGEADPWTIREALAAGAYGFVAKTRSVEWLAGAIEMVLNGQEFLCEDSQAALQRGDQNGTAAVELPGPAILSRREREILRCLAHGENTKSIASLLGISPKTVETHRQHIMRKLATNNVAALTRYAIQHGMTAL
jgi:two-component system NarL family response regulator